MKLIIVALLLSSTTAFTSTDKNNVTFKAANKEYKIYCPSLTAIKKIADFTNGRNSNSLYVNNSYNLSISDASDSSTLEIQQGAGCIVDSQIK